MSAGVGNIRLPGCYQEQLESSGFLEGIQAEVQCEEVLGDSYLVLSFASTGDIQKFKERFEQAEKGYFIDENNSPYDGFKNYKETLLTYKDYQNTLDYYRKITLTPNANEMFQSLTFEGGDTLGGQKLKTLIQLGFFKTDIQDRNPRQGLINRFLNHATPVFFWQKGSDYFVITQEAYDQNIKQSIDDLINSINVYANEEFSLQQTPWGVLPVVRYEGHHYRYSPILVPDNSDKPQIINVNDSYDVRSSFKNGEFKMEKGFHVPSADEMEGFLKENPDLLGAPGVELVGGSLRVTRNEFGQWVPIIAHPSSIKANECAADKNPETKFRSFDEDLSRKDILNVLNWLGVENGLDKTYQFCVDPESLNEDFKKDTLHFYMSLSYEKAKAKARALYEVLVPLNQSHSNCGSAAFLGVPISPHDICSTPNLTVPDNMAIQLPGSNYFINSQTALKVLAGLEDYIDEQVYEHSSASKTAFILDGVMESISTPGLMDFFPISKCFDFIQIS